MRKYQLTLFGVGWTVVDWRGRTSPSDRYEFTMSRPGRFVKVEGDTAEAVLLAGEIERFEQNEKGALNGQ